MQSSILVTPDLSHCLSACIAALIKKKTKFSLFIYKEIQMGSVAKSYMRKGFLIYEEMHKY
jgi:hypothetical protein